MTSIKDSKGVLLQQAIPSIPVQVAGFSELPQVGDLLRFFQKKIFIVNSKESERQPSVVVHGGQENAINC